MFYWAGVKDLEFYNNEFEEPLLIKSTEEYEVKSLKWIGECTAPEYLTLADQAYLHEESYCNTLLEAESRGKLLSRVDKELIGIRKQQIIDKETGCRYMIENNKGDDLALMYKCFVREDTNLGVIIHCLCEYTESLGNKYVEDVTLTADPCAFTQKLLDFKKEVDSMIEYSFSNNIKFEKGRDTSFQNFMN